VFQSAFKQVAISIEIGYSGYIIEPQPQALADSTYVVVENSISRQRTFKVFAIPGEGEGVSTVGLLSIFKARR